MDFFLRHKLITLTFLIQIIALPILLIIAGQAQEPRSHAASPTGLNLDISNQNLYTGEYFSVNVNLNPGDNLAQGVKVVVNYDPTKIEIVTNNPIFINSESFQNVIEKPTFSSGKIEFSLAVANPTKVIRGEPVKVASIFFKALQTTDKSTISLGSGTLVTGLNNVSLSSTLNSSSITISTSSAQPQISTFPVFKQKKK